MFSIHIIYLFMNYACVTLLQLGYLCLPQSVFCVIESIAPLLVN